MDLDESASQAASTVKKSARKASGAVKKSARKAAGTAARSTRAAADAVQDSAEKAATATKGRARKAAATVRATRAARAGLVEDARRIADEAELDDEGAATKAIEKVEEQHYDVVVNKRALSVTGLTVTLNERWRNGWTLAHAFEQRGNTVLVFEKRS